MILKAECKLVEKNYSKAIKLKCGNAEFIKGNSVHKRGYVELPSHRVQYLKRISPWDNIGNSEF